MPNILFDLVDPRDLTTFVRGVDRPEQWILNRFLPDRVIQGVKFKLQTRSGKVIPALWRVYDAETPVGQRPGLITVTEGLLPPIGTKTVLDEYEQLLLDMARGVNQNALVPQIYNDAETNTLAVRAALELARGDLLEDGAMSLPIEGGQTFDLDLQVPADHLPVQTTDFVAWDDPAATPLTDEQAWQQKRVDDEVGEAAVALTSRKVRALLLKNAEYRAAFWGGNAGQQPNLNQDQLNAVRSSNGLPPIVTYDVSINGQRVIADNKFLLLPGATGIGGDPAQLGRTLFGTTVEGLTLSRGGNPRIAFDDTPGLVGVVQEDGDPVRVWTKVAGVGMPILDDPKQLFTAEVI